MPQPDFVSTLAERLSAYVEFRTLGGVDARAQIQLLRPFDRFLQQQGFQGPWPTRDLLQRYLSTLEPLHPGSRGNRLAVVRQFCRYLRQFEPEAYLPPRIRSLERRPLRVPYLYTESQIQALLQAARRLGPSGSLRPQTYCTFFGLLYTTGLRCGEAFALNLGDVDLPQQLLYVHRGKFGKSRLVPLSASTSRVLRRYRKQRCRAYPRGSDRPLFVTLTGHRLYHTNADFALRQCLRRCALRGGKDCPGPRLHDLRHSYASTRLLSWYREGKDPQALLPLLATYLGHVSVTSTQVYLRATAELLEQAQERFRANFRQNILPKGEAP